MMLCVVSTMCPPAHLGLQTGMLWNTEGGSPMIPIGEDDLPTPIMVRYSAAVLLRYRCSNTPLPAIVGPQLQRVRLCDTVSGC
jgi:hypothetical protein